MNYSKIFWMFSGEWKRSYESNFIATCCFMEAMFQTRTEAQQHAEEVYYDNVYVAYDNVVDRWIVFTWTNSVRRERKAA